MFANIRAVTVGQRRSMRLAVNKNSLFTTLKRPAAAKRSRPAEDHQQKQEEELASAAPKKKRVCIIVSPPVSASSPTTTTTGAVVSVPTTPAVAEASSSSSAAAGITGAMIDEMAAKCADQRRHAVNVLWVTCKHLFPQDVYSRYLIFSLAVYLFDAFILQEFVEEETSESRPEVFRLCDSVIHSTTIALYPPLYFCCLIMAAKIDTGHTIRVARVFEQRAVYYSFEAHKYFDSRVAQPGSYVVFSSDTREAANFQYIESIHLADEREFDKWTHPANKLFQFRSVYEIDSRYTGPAEPTDFDHFQEKDTLYARYLRQMELYILTHALPFRESTDSKWKPDWIFPNPCLFREQVLLAAAAVEKKDEEESNDDDDDVLFVRVGQQVVERHLSEFSFGSAYFAARQSP